MSHRPNMPKRLTLLIAAALVLSACGSSASEEPIPSAPIVSIPATTRAADDAAASQSAATTSGAATTASTDTPAATTVVPALGIDVSATDSFDSEGLNLGNTNFVSMDDPLMVPASEVTWLADDDVVMGLVHNSGETHAYPINQMAYHHIANTTIAGEPFLVTY